MLARHKNQLVATDLRRSLAPCIVHVTVQWPVVLCIFHLSPRLPPTARAALVRIPDPHSHALTVTSPAARLLWNRELQCRHGGKLCLSSFLGTLNLPSPPASLSFRAPHRLAAKRSEAGGTAERRRRQRELSRPRPRNSNSSVGKGAGWRISGVEERRREEGSWVHFFAFGVCGGCGRWCAGGAAEQRGRSHELSPLSFFPDDI